MRYLLFTYRANLAHIARLVADLTDEQMVQQPHGLVNHPAWTVGHLAQVSDFVATVMGLESTFPEEWRELFRAGQEAPPGGDPSAFPPRERLLAELTAQHARVADSVANADSAVLEGEHPVDGLRERFPTMGDLVGHVLSAHEANHIGQIAAWRRAMGLAPMARP